MKRPGVPGEAGRTASAGWVIAVHIAFMHLPSPVTGALVDRLGRKPLLVASDVTLLEPKAAIFDVIGRFHAGVDAR